MAKTVIRANPDQIRLYSHQEMESHFWDLAVGASKAPLWDNDIRDYFETTTARARLYQIVEDLATVHWQRG